MFEPGCMIGGGGGGAGGGEWIAWVWHGWAYNGFSVLSRSATRETTLRYHVYK